PADRRCHRGGSMTLRSRPLALALAVLVAPAVRGQEAPVKPDAPKPSTAEESREVRRVHFRGNRKVEDDALRVNLRTVPGAIVTQDMIRDDVRTIWRMGFFEDVQVEVTPMVGGGVIVIF